MTATPRYNHYPYRLGISGAEAIKELWRRTLSLQCLSFEAGRTLISKERYFAETSIVDVVQNTFHDDRGALIPSTYVVAFHFEGLSIASETSYVDGNMTPYLDTVFTDPDFLSLPGVERF
jgi:hypothetical protein